jgi:hypothetical protein
MEPFFYRWGRKNLPGKHGQQAVIAACPHPDFFPNKLNTHRFQTWHGIR